MGYSPEIMPARLFLEGFLSFGTDRRDQNGDERSEGNDQDGRTDRALEKYHWVAT